MTRDTKRRYLDALQDRKLPVIRQAFDQARLFAWELDGNRCTFTPDKAVRKMSELLAAMVDDDEILGGKATLVKGWGSYSIKVDYVYKVVTGYGELPKCFTCYFSL